jgi:ubiquinone/menaquinone biosynthesis C-methylase UbiE/uncharacterized protein YbaR (Trm112 family)
VPVGDAREREQEAVQQGALRAQSCRSALASSDDRDRCQYALAGFVGDRRVFATCYGFGSLTANRVGEVSVDLDHLSDVLRCSVCGAPYAISDDRLTCSSCGRCFVVVDGIPVLLDESTVGTTLDRIDDYGAFMGIDESVIRQTGREWKKIIGRLGYTPEQAFEIGSGTGALTLGLLEEGVVRRLTSTDVSLKFLRSLTSRASGYSIPVSLVACDANEPHFRAEAFDLVVGRSVLHHLLDYDQTLAHCRVMLKSGGAAVFYEPVIEGQTITTLFMALMLRCDDMTSGAYLSEPDRRHISGLIRNQTKSTFLRDRESLAKVEDKYIFEIEKMKQVGLDAGFTEVEFFNDTRGLSYWAYISHACRVVGVAPETIRPFKWIEEAFSETYGLMFPERLVTPTGYFVFSR